MSFTRHPNFLRTILLIDAAICVVTGAVMTLGATPIDMLTNVPRELLFYSGLSLFPIAAFIALVGTRTALPTPGVWLVILGNVGWVAASVWVLLAGTADPNTLGVAFIAFQALAVAVLAELEFMGLRSSAESDR